MAEPSAYAAALRLLARRAHFRAELEHKLNRRDFDAHEIEETLDRLTEQGLIDDRANAHAFVEERRRRAPLGRYRLRAELRAKGVDEADAEAAVADLDDDDDRDAAERATAHWLDCGGARKKGAQALARHLERRGFPAAVIAAMLREHRDALREHQTA